VKRSETQAMQELIEALIGRPGTLTVSFPSLKDLCLAATVEKNLYERIEVPYEGQPCVSHHKTEGMGVTGQWVNTMVVTGRWIDGDIYRGNCEGYFGRTDEGSESQTVPVVKVYSQIINSRYSKVKKWYPNGVREEESLWKRIPNIWNEAGEPMRNVTPPRPRCIYVPKVNFSVYKISWDKYGKIKSFESYNRQRRVTFNWDTDGFISFEDNYSSQTFRKKEVLSEGTLVVSRGVLVPSAWGWWRFEQGESPKNEKGVINLPQFEAIYGSRN